MLHEYNSEVFTELPHYDRAKSLVGTDSLKTAVDALGKLIIANRLETTVGVCLLHKHFDMDSDEILLETAHGDTSKLSPVVRAGVESKVLPYMWKMDKNMCWSPLEFAYSTKQMQNALDKIMKDEDFLRAIGTTLLKLQVNDILGLSLLHRDHINGFTGGTLETSDENNRELVVTSMNKSTNNDDLETIQTLWKFGSGGMSENKCTHCTHCKHTK